MTLPGRRSRIFSPKRPILGVPQQTRLGEPNPEHSIQSGEVLPRLPCTFPVGR